MKIFSLVAFIATFVSAFQGYSQELELSGGLSHKYLLGKQRSFYAPVFGFEIGAARQEGAPFSSDMVAYGASVGVFRLQRSDQEGDGQFQQLVETKATFRYDLYYSDLITFFYGAEAGFSFTTIQNNQPVISVENSPTQLYTRGIVAPNGGVNLEFNRYIAVYYKLQYDLGKYFGTQPDWGAPSSKWNHLMTQTAGVRLRFW